MAFSIGVRQKPIYIGEFVEDIPSLSNRPEILTWSIGERQKPVFGGEFQEVAKVPPRYQLRQFVIRLRTGGEPMRVTGHCLKIGTTGFVTVVHRSFRGTSTVAMFAADQVLAIVEEPLVMPAPLPAKPVVTVVEGQAAPAEEPVAVGK